MALKKMMIRLLFLIPAAICFSLTASAQSPDSIFYFNFAGTGNINTTNNSTAYIFNNGIKFDMVQKNFTINTLNTWIFGENEGEKTNNDYLSVVDVDLFKKKRTLYYWALASFEKSYSLDILNRFQTGGGVGFNIITEKKAKLVVTDGPLYETSQLKIPDEYGRLKYETFRNSLRVKFHFLIRDLFIIDGTDFLQNSFSHSNDYNIRSITSLGFKINKWLSFNTAVTYNKINLTSNENFLFTYGLSLDKYF